MLEHFIEEVQWGHDYRRVGMEVVNRFRDIYQVGRGWDDLIDKKFIPTLDGRRVGLVEMHALGFIVAFYPPVIMPEDEGERVVWRSREPRFKLLDTGVMIPNEYRFAVFNTNFEILNDLAGEFDLEIHEAEQSLVFPRWRFATPPNNPRLRPIEILS